MGYRHLNTLHNLSQNESHLKFAWICSFQLSLASNHIVDIKGISAASSLRVLDLSNNSIVATEGILFAAL